MIGNMSQVKTKLIYKSDEKMLMLIDILKSNGTIKTDYEFCEAIEFNHTNLPKIKNQTKHFTADHIRKACLKYKGNANWVFGLSDNIFLDKNMNEISVHKKVHKTA